MFTGRYMLNKITKNSPAYATNIYIKIFEIMLENQRTFTEMPKRLWYLTSRIMILCKKYVGKRLFFIEISIRN